MTAQTLDDLEALTHWCTEVARTFNQVALIDVVRADAILDELVHQLAHDVHAIVDAREQHRLVADRNTSACELVDGA